MIRSDRQRVRADKTPNRHYHKHEGYILRYLSDLDDNHLLAEVVWDKPFPVETMARQVMNIES